MPKKKEEPTDNMPFGDCTFQITTANEVRLKAMSKYAMMLDYVVDADNAEKLNIDGLINSILEEGMVKRLKELSKKHGFESPEDFVESLLACQDGEETAYEIKEQERSFYQKMHDEILSHISVEDNSKQKSFEF